MAYLLIKIILIQVIFNKYISSYDIKTKDWLQFKKELDIKFSSNDQEIQKLKVFQENKNFVDQHNKNKSNKYKLKLNKKSLYTNDEFKKMYSIKPNLDLIESKLRVSSSNYINAKSASLRQSYLNYVDLDYVSPVRDQGICGSCYSFASVSGYESHYAIKTGNKMILSVQQIVDCSIGYPYKNNGCGGGEIGSTFNYIYRNGLETDEIYPYMDKQGKCKYDSSKARYRLSGSSYVYHDLNGMYNALINRGPLVAYICGLSLNFQQYNSGVYNDPQCPNTLAKVNHVVLIVGYGTDNQTGEDYWLVKNSWGDTWGENGFMRIARGINMCGIEILSYYPIISY